MASSGDDEAPGRARIVRLRRGVTILLCGKCLKRHADGKALRRAIKAEAKGHAAANPTSGKVRVVKIGCLGLCPRRAVVVASAASLSAGEVVLVRDANEGPEALSRLLCWYGRRVGKEAIVADQMSSTEVEQ